MRHGPRLPRPPEKHTRLCSERKPDSDELPPVELRHNLALFAARARKGLPLCEEKP